MGRSVLKYREVTRYSSCGDPFTTLRREMRIRDALQQSVVFLYETPEAAKQNQAGEGPSDEGGTGFWVAVDFGGTRFFYVVTCAHVVTGGFTTVCFNRVNGSRESFQTEKSNWTLHPKDDIAVLPLAFDPAGRDIIGVPSSMFLTKELIAKHDVGLGDEVQLFGRFIHHSGIKKVLPAVRFGNIAMMDEEPIYNDYLGLKRDAFLVEMRSINGYSGSLAVVRKRPSTSRFDESIDDAGEMTATVTPFGEHREWVLGIDWGHIWEDREGIIDNGPMKLTMRTNSNMTCVTPAWRLMEVLNSPVLKRYRDETNAKLERQQRPKGSGAKVDLAMSGFTPVVQEALKEKLESGDEGEADFDSAMRRVVPREQDDEA